MTTACRGCQWCGNNSQIADILWVGSVFTTRRQKHKRSLIIHPGVDCKQIAMSAHLVRFAKIEGYGHGS
jgi:hypothetical protein